MSFYDAIRDELEALDHEGGSGFHEFPHVQGARGVHIGAPAFGADYDSNADIVRQVQQAINAAGYAPALDVDGAYGPKTAAGIKWLQAQKGLSADGIIGPATLGALGIAAPQGPSAPPPNAPKGAFPITKATGLSSIPGLKQDVIDAFTSFSTHLEGYTPYMYTDSKGYVTTGIGNLIDSVGAALTLPWKNPDGSRATSDQISAAWNAVKSAYPATKSTASQGLTSLRLDQDGIAQLVWQKLQANHNYLKSKYPNYVNWPADAQLALHSISWAWGPGFAGVWGSNGIAFNNAVNANPPDFNKAADVMMTASGHEESINPGIIPRDAANVLMFTNAAEVLANGMDSNALVFPGAASASAAVTALTMVPSHLISRLIRDVKSHPYRTAGIITGVVAAVGTLLALILGAKKEMPLP